MSTCSRAVHERGAIVHVAVLLAAIGLQRMRVDNGSAGFDARDTLVDDLLGQNWNSGLDPTCRGSVDGDFNTALLNHDPRSVLGSPSLNHGSAGRGKDNDRPRRHRTEIGLKWLNASVEGCPRMSNADSDQQPKADGGDGHAAVRAGRQTSARFARYAGAAAAVAWL